MSRPNTSQRSWSNYVGDRPIKSWVGRDPVSSDVRFYADSLNYGPGATPAPAAVSPVEAMKSFRDRFEENAARETAWEKQQRTSALRRGMQRLITAPGTNYVV